MTVEEKEVEVAAMAADEKPAAGKEKKTRARKEKKPKGSKPPAPSHPPYFQMIKEAIMFLNEKTGSSAYAIAKHMEGNHKADLPANYKKVLAVQLRNFAAKGKLVKVKASFKLAETRKVAAKKDEATGTTKRKTRSVASLRSPAAVKGKKGGVVKKGRKKKTGAVKAKQPKSIKAPSAKRARASA